MSETDNNLPSDPLWKRLPWVRARIREAVNRPFEMIVDVLTTSTAIDPAAILGEEYQVEREMPQEDGVMQRRRWTGKVVELRAMGEAAPGDVTDDTGEPRDWVQLRCVPDVAQMALNHRSVAYLPTQNDIGMNLTDLLNAVLARNGVSGFVNGISTSTYPTQPLALQLAESDLDFFCRTAEHHGVSWYWTADLAVGEATLPGAVLHLTDDSGSFPTVAPVNMERAAGEPDVVGVRRIRWNRGQVPQKVTASGWDPITTNQAVRGESLMAAGRPWQAVEGYERALRGQALSGLQAGWATSNPAPEQAWANRLAYLRHMELGAAACLATGQGNVLRLAPASVVKITDTVGGAFSAATYAEWLLLEVEHVIRRDGAGDGLDETLLQDGGPAGASYWNSFIAVPHRMTNDAAILDFAPARRTPTPGRLLPARARIAAVEPEQMTPDLDGQGRYLVAFDFEMAHVPATGKEKPRGVRLRLLAPYGAFPVEEAPAEGETKARGKVSGGLHMPLHPGMNVILGFQEGVLHLPFILGVLPDPTQPSTVDSANPKQSVLRTASGITLRLADNL